MKLKIKSCSIYIDFRLERKSSQNCHPSHDFFGNLKSLPTGFQNIFCQWSKLSGILLLNLRWQKDQEIDLRFGRCFVKERLAHSSLLFPQFHRWPDDVDEPRYCRSLDGSRRSPLDYATTLSTIAILVTMQHCSLQRTAWIAHKNSNGTFLLLSSLQESADALALKTSYKLCLCFAFGWNNTIERLLAIVLALHPEFWDLVWGRDEKSEGDGGTSKFSLANKGGSLREARGGSERREEAWQETLHTCFEIISKLLVNIKN